MTREKLNGTAGESPDELARVTARKLGDRTILGAMWTSVGAGTRLLLHGIIFVILARLLNAEDFGIYSLGAVAVGTSRVFGEVGLGPALIQRRLLDENHIRTAFTTTIALSLLIGVGLWFLSPFLGEIMGSSALGPVIRALSLLFVIRGLGLVANALLQRDLRFPELARSDVLSYLIGYGLVGITLAVMGLGYWALVWAALVQACMQNLQYLILRPHIKRLGIYWKPLKDLMSFGIGSTVGRLGNYLAMKGDYLVVGRFLGVASLGLYSRAYELMAMPVGLYQSAANQSLFSAVAKVQDEQIRLSRAHRRASSVTAILLLPLGLALFILAPEVIHIILGPKWISVVDPFRVMALGLFFRSGYNVGAALAKGTGHVHRLAIRQWAYAIFVVTGAWVGHHFGITGAAIGVVVALVLQFIFVSHLSLQSSGLSVREFGRAHVSGIVLGATVLMTLTGCTYLLRGLGSPAILTLLGSTLFTLAVSLALIRYLPLVFLGRDGIWALVTVTNLLPSRGLGRWLQRALGISGGQSHPSHLPSLDTPVVR